MTLAHSFAWSTRMRVRIHRGVDAPAPAGRAAPQLARAAASACTPGLMSRARVLARLSPAAMPSSIGRGTARASRARCGAAGESSGQSGGEVRVRFAPSPTGKLHVGGARTALFNWLFARRHEGGKFVLRIEDTDKARSTAESEANMLRELRWMGLDWDEGPDVGGAFGPYRQSERTDIYAAKCEELVQAGLAYPCFCTNDELAEAKAKAEQEGRPPIYSGKWATASEQEVRERVDAGEKPVIRFRVPKDRMVAVDDLVRGLVRWNTNTLGDFVIMRSDGSPVYNFCVAVDDASMGITHVIRAEEHLPNTLKQVLVYEALGLEPPRFSHVSLILAPDKSKLSKRHGATSVGEFEGKGYLRDALVNYLALLGWNDGTEQEVYSREELVDKFSLERITKSAAVFDLAKLTWMNSQFIREMPDDALAAQVAEVWAEEGVFTAGAGEDAKSSLLGSFLAMSKENFTTTRESGEVLADLLRYPLEETLASAECAKVVEDNFGDIADEVLASYASGELAAALAEEGGWKPLVKSIGKKAGKAKGKRLFLPLRVALTGQMRGPDVGQVLELLLATDGVVSADFAEGALVPLERRMEKLEQWVANAKANAPVNA